MTMFSKRRIVWVFLMAFATAGWGQPADSAAGASRDYRLQPGDVIRVNVFQEPELDRELRISQEGFVFLPLIGRVELKDRSIDQAEALIRELYDRDYLVNPQVNVIVLRYQVRTINVLGAVNSPGAIEYPPEQTLTVLDAISRAGGFNRLADRRRIRLTRTYAGGRTENYIINGDELMSGSSNEPWVVLRDDVIFVPERVL